MTNNTRIVSQRARDRAADWYVDHEEIAEAYRDRIKSGQWDDDQLVQFLARFEEETLALSRDGERANISKIIDTANEPQSFHEMREYAKELEELWAYQKGQADSWRGIAAAMGYEPNAHQNVRPTDPWIIARIEKYRAALSAAPYRDCEGKIVLQMLVQTNDDTPHGIMDCLRTTDGTPYQSVHMKKLIEHARTLVGEVK